MKLTLLFLVLLGTLELVVCKPSADPLFDNSRKWVKEKLSWAGDQLKEYGQKAYDYSKEKLTVLFNATKTKFQEYKEKTVAFFETTWSKLKEGKYKEAAKDTVQALRNALKIVSQDIDTLTDAVKSEVRTMVKPALDKLQNVIFENVDLLKAIKDQNDLNNQLAENEGKSVEEVVKEQIALTMQSKEPNTYTCVRNSGALLLLRGKQIYDKLKECTSEAYELAQNSYEKGAQFFKTASDLFDKLDDAFECGTVICYSKKAIGMIPEIIDLVDLIYNNAPEIWATMKIQFEKLKECLPDWYKDFQEYIQNVNDMRKNCNVK